MVTYNLALPLLISIALPIVGIASAQSTAAPVNASLDMPSTIRQCDTVNGRRNCSIWTYDGKSGYNAKWDDGSVAHIVVVQFDSESVQFLRQDILTKKTQVAYSGHRIGDEVKDGILTFKLFGHSFNGSWTASLSYPPGSPAATSSQQNSASIQQGRMQTGVGVASQQAASRYAEICSTLASAEQCAQGKADLERQLAQTQSEALQTGQKSQMALPQPTSPAPSTTHQSVPCSALISANDCAQMNAKMADEQNRQQKALESLKRQSSSAHTEAGLNPVRLGLSTQTILTKGVAVIPVGLRSAYKTASCKVNIIIGKDGLVKTAEYESGLCAVPLGETAEDAARHYIFKPFKINDAIVEVSTSIGINFSLVDLPHDDEGFPVASPAESSKHSRNDLPQSIFLCNGRGCNMWPLNPTGKDYSAKMVDGPVDRLSFISIGDGRIEFVQEEGEQKYLCKGRLVTDGNAYGFTSIILQNGQTADYGRDGCTAELIYSPATPAKNFLFGSWGPDTIKSAPTLAGNPKSAIPCPAYPPGQCESFQETMRQANAVGEKRLAEIKNEVAKQQVITFAPTEMIMSDQTHVPVEYRVNSSNSVTVGVSKYRGRNGDEGGYSLECRVLETQTLLCSGGSTDGLGAGTYKHLPTSK